MFGFGHQRHDDQRLHRECRLQPGLGAQAGQTLRAEYRLVVPLRAGRGSELAGLRREAGRAADEGAGRGYDFERHHGPVPAAGRGFRLRFLALAGPDADRQGDPGGDRADDPRGAGRADPRGAGRRADGGRAALPGGRAA